MAKRAPLAADIGSSTPAEQVVQAGSAQSSGQAIVKSYTLRLPEEVWRQLNVASAQEGVTARSIIVAGLNSEFRKRGLPPIAE